MSKESQQEFYPNKQDFVKFSQETRVQLEQAGLLIWQLRGVSVFQLKQQGANIFSYDTPLDYFTNYHTEQLSQPSRKSEIAFFPQRFIPEETKYTFNYSQQLASARDYYRKYDQRDVRLIVGSVADYCDLLLYYHELTGSSLIPIAQDVSKDIQTSINTATYCGYRAIYSEVVSQFLAIRPTLKNPINQKQEYGLIISECCHCHNTVGSRGIAPFIAPDML